MPISWKQTEQHETKNQPSIQCWRTFSRIRIERNSRTCWHGHRSFMSMQSMSFINIVTGIVLIPCSFSHLFLTPHHTNTVSYTDRPKMHHRNKTQFGNTHTRHKLWLLLFFKIISFTFSIISRLMHTRNISAIRILSVRCLGVQLSFRQYILLYARRSHKKNHTSIFNTDAYSLLKKCQ